MVEGSNVEPSDEVRFASSRDTCFTQVLGGYLRRMSTFFVLYIFVFPVEHPQCFEEPRELS
jgi:hypothetical protein